MSNVLTQQDVRNAHRRMLLMFIGTFNYSTQLAPTVVYGLAPALRKIYPNDEDYKAALDNHYKYFNTQPYMMSLVIGAALGMEEQLGIEGKDTIQDFKAGVMGPLAGVGDSVFWIILPAIFTPIAAAMAYEGSYAGIIISVIFQIVLHCIRFRFFEWGYKLGTNIVNLMRDKLSIVTDAASVLGLTVIGAMIPTAVSVTCPLEWTLSTGSVINIQTLLDRLFPNLLAMAITLGCSALLGKSKVTMTQLVLVVLVIGIICSALGILA